MTRPVFRARSTSHTVAAWRLHQNPACGAQGSGRREPFSKTAFEAMACYMAQRRGGPSQGWRTFLCNHADGIAAMDLFVVLTLSFRLLYGLLILRHRRRQIMWLGRVTLRGTV